MDGNRAVQLATRAIVDLVCDGRFEEAIRMCSSSRLTAKDLERTTRRYGCTFVQPPLAIDGLVDAVAIKGMGPLAWSVRAPLWTLEEGRSDLTLELTVTASSTGAVVELDDLRVL
jgi:hypothetical protein